MYSQAPDEVGEYDAISRSIAHVRDVAQLGAVVAYNTFRAALAKLESAVDVPAGGGLSGLLPEGRLPAGRFSMDDIHKGGHVLNGEPAWLTQSVTSRVMKSAPNLESRGVSLHAYGDAYHHASLWSEDRSVMSNPFVGHLMSWDFPDRVGTDPSQFRRYTAALARDLAEAGGFNLTGSEIAKISSELSDLAGVAVIIAEERGRGVNDVLIPHDVRMDAVGFTDLEAIYIRLLREQIRERWGAFA